MYCISAVMGMVAIMVVKREFLEAVILTAVAAVLLCVFVADHSSLRAIMQAGISPAEEKNDKSGQTADSEKKAEILEEHAGGEVSDCSDSCESISFDAEGETDTEEPADSEDADAAEYSGPAEAGVLQIEPEDSAETEKEKDK